MKLRPQARRLGRQPSAQVSEQEMQIRKGLESMRDATAREVMTPRVDVVALAVPVTFDDVARAVRRSGCMAAPTKKYCTCWTRSVPKTTLPATSRRSKKEKGS